MSNDPETSEERVKRKGRTRWFSVVIEFGSSNEKGNCILLVVAKCIVIEIISNIGEPG